MAETVNDCRTCSERCDLDRFVTKAKKEYLDDEYIGSVDSTHGEGAAVGQLTKILLGGAPVDFVCSGRLDHESEFTMAETVSDDGMHTQRTGIDCPVMIEALGDQLIRTEVLVTDEDGKVIN